ncbi:MAG: hypothetical protein ACLUOI_26935 [Eisenbergiella sp.]
MILVEKERRIGAENQNCWVYKGELTIPTWSMEIAEACGISEKYVSVRKRADRQDGRGIIGKYQDVGM